tara:strand:- start:163 stop:2025 length:1863 start_codon:yes stop_codon:yes gene_type:complete
MYGISNYLLLPPFSLIISFIMCLGVTHIGYTAINTNKFKGLFNNYKYRNFFSPLIGSYILIFFIYPFLFFGLFNKNFFIFIASTIFILGVFFLLNNISKITKKKLLNLYKLPYQFDLLLLILFLLGFFLISISPITHSDSFMYHVQGSLDVLNKGIFATDALQMLDLLVSGGEIFIILGFALKSQELGNLIQYLSILSLIPIFLSIKISENNSLIFPILGILSSFCMFFLISSPKPQMLHIMGCLFVFSFMYSNLHTLNKKNFFWISFILTAILIINIQIKFSFVLGSVLLISSLFIYSINKSFVKEYIFVLLCLFIILVLPSFIFRNSQFNTGLIDLFLSPLPLNIHGFLEFQNSTIKQSSYGVFPLWLIIPNELKNFSSVIGPIIFIVFVINKKNIKDNRYFFIGLSLFFLLAINFGQPSARFIFDGFICLVYLIFNLNFKYYMHVKIFFNLIRLQSIFLIIALFLFVFRVFPGSLNLNYYEKVMHKNTNGYSLMKWANTKLTKDSVVLSTHDSVSLLNNKSFNYYFLDFVDFRNNSSQIFIKSIKKNNINTVLFFGINGNELQNAPYFDKLENCLGNLISHKKNVGRHVGRNPFQQGSPYGGWLFEFNIKKFPQCLK